MKSNIIKIIFWILWMLLNLVLFIKGTLPDFYAGAILGISFFMFLTTIIDTIISTLGQRKKS